MDRKAIADLFDAEGLEELITPVEELDPELRSLLEKDHPMMAGRIQKWLGVMTLSMDIDFAEARDFDMWMAVRELLQNAYDEAEKTFGYDGIAEATGVVCDESGKLIIFNRGGDKLLPKHFLFKKFKGEAYRGRFGEGMKLTLAWLVSKGFTVYAFSYDAVYKFFSKPGDFKLLMVGLGIPNEPVNGTWFYIFGDPEMIEDICNLAPTISVFEIIRRNPDAVLQEFPILIHNIPRKEHILDLPDKLYVDDIFVNEISRLYDKKSIFGYNVWGVRLEPNRRMIIYFDRIMLKDKIARMLSKAREDIRNMLFSKLVKKADLDVLTTTFGIDVYDIEDYFEADLGGDLADRFKEWAEFRFGKVFQIKKQSLPALQNIAYVIPKDITLIVCDKNICYKLPNIAEFLTEYEIEFIPARLEDVTIETLAAMNMIIGMIYTISKMENLRRVPKIIPVSEFGDKAVCGLYDHEKNLIALLWDAGFSTAVEEMMHYLATELYGAGKDLTKSFETAIFSIVSKLNQATVAFGVDYDDMMSRLIRYPSIAFVGAFNEGGIEKVEKNRVLLFMSSFRKSEFERMKRNITNALAPYEDEVVISKIVERMKEMLKEMFNNGFWCMYAGFAVGESGIAKSHELIFRDLNRRVGEWYKDMKEGPDVNFRATQIYYRLGSWKWVEEEGARRYIFRVLYNPFTGRFDYDLVMRL